MKKIFSGKARGGKFVPNEGKMLKDLLTRLDGDNVYITISNKKPRSVEQNAYFHGVILKMLSSYTGHSADEMKLCLRNMFLMKMKSYPRYEKKEGKLIKGISMEQVPVSTSELSTKEFEDFNKRCRAFGAELGVSIPLPNEVELQNFIYN